MACDVSALIESRIDRIGTQYRESPILLGAMRSYLQEVAEAYCAIDAIPSAFDIDTATGDQLTIIGKWLGFPRCHCACVATPTFGFACPDDEATGRRVMGFEPGARWPGCDDLSTTDICLYDDDLYRRVLLVRRYQYLSLFDIESLHEAVKIMWGPQAFAVEQEKSVVLVPMRELTREEEDVIPIIFRAMPIAPGIKGYWHRGDKPIFGFGSGWVGFCPPEDPVDDTDPCLPFLVFSDCDYTETGYSADFIQERRNLFCSIPTSWMDDKQWDDTLPWWQLSGPPLNDCWDKYSFCGEDGKEALFCEEDPAANYASFICPIDPYPYGCPGDNEPCFWDKNWCIPGRSTLCP